MFSVAPLFYIILPFQEVLVLSSAGSSVVVDETCCLYACSFPISVTKLASYINDYFHYHNLPTRVVLRQDLCTFDASAT